MHKNKWIKIIVSIISPIFSFLGMSLFNMPLIVFVIIMIIMIGYFIVHLAKLYLVDCCVKDLSREMHKIADKILKIESEKDIEHQKKKYEKKKRKKSKYSKMRKEIISNLVASVIISILFCLPRIKAVNIFAKEIIDDVVASFAELNKQEEIIQPQPNEEEETIKFTIEYPDGHPQIKNEEVEGLYDSLFYKNEKNLNEIMKGKIRIWLNSYKVNVSLDTAVTSSGKSTEYYSNIEKGFTNKNGVILSSNLLDEVISGRKELFDLYPNGTLSWLLANHMQTYALNYENQTSAGESILCFYMKSIEYTQKSLEFEMDNKTKYKYIRYLHSRYKDIAECENIDEVIRLRAYEIYISIQEVLEELGIPQ